MTPEAYAQYLALQSGAPLPVYKLTPRDKLVPPDQPVLMIPEGGTPYVLVSEAQQHWTADHIRAHEQAGLAEWPQWAEKNKLSDARDQLPGGKETRAQLSAMAQRMGLNPDLPVYLTSNDSAFAKAQDPQAMAMQTHEGSPYVIVNQASLNLPPDKFLAMMGHEFDHVKNGDISATRMAETRNNPEVQTAREKRADIEGSYYSGKPQALAELFQTILAEQYRYFMERKPQGTPEQFYAELKKNDPEHDNYGQRALDLEALQKYMVRNPDGTPSLSPTDYNRLVKPVVEAANKPQGQQR